MPNAGPDTPSGDYEAMAPLWTVTDTMLQGANAVRAAGEAFLPKQPNETLPRYELRRANAKFTNIYRDIVESLAAKPFAKAVALTDGASERVKALAEDIDGRGNNLHVFAGQTFFEGVNRGVDWILVDHTRAAPREDGRPLTLEDERRQGLRPYWVHVPATRVLAVYSEVIGGVEIYTHVRIREDVTERDGFDEVSIERVRVFDREPIVSVIDGVERVTSYAPATFTVWEKKAPKGRARNSTWEIVDAGPVSIGVIPMVPFVTGRRQESSWRLVPPMQNVADLQVEHYQAENEHKNLRVKTAFPMLKGMGISPPMDGEGNPAQVQTGPDSVLYAPPVGDNGQHGDWEWMKADATVLKEHRDGIASIEQQMREIGRQPLTAQSGNLTVVTTQFAAQKGNSAVQAWALNLKDALEQAFALTAKWLRDATEAEVQVHTDFALDGGDEKGPDVLLSMRERGDLSRQTFWREMQRRDILSGDFDADAEGKLIEDEQPDPDDEVDLTAAAGLAANAA